MKTWLDAHMAGPIWTADLVTITLTDGTILRLTNCDTNLTVGGNTFVSGGGSSTSPGIQIGDIENSAGTETSEAEIEFLCSPSVLLGSRVFALCAAEGALEGAHVLIEQTIGATPGDISLGKIWIFEGNVSELSEVRASRVVAKIADWTEGLNTQIPKRLLQPSCPFGFCDAACGLTAATYTASLVIGSGATVSTIPISGGRLDGYYDLGILVVTSGTDAGLTRDVVSYASGVLTIAPPLPRAPANADTCTVMRGCAHTVTACTAYGNQNRNGGFPFVSKPESVR